MNNEFLRFAHLKNNEELKEIFNILEERGWNPMVCDTPIGVSNNKVKCGPPTGYDQFLKRNEIVNKC